MSAATEQPMVLVVDDVDTVINVVANFLGRAGFNVITAASGRAAIKILETTCPDVILCDYAMPDLSGFDVLEWVRENEATRDLPFLLMTGGFDNLPIYSPYRPGQVILKPFTQNEIVKVISRTIAKDKGRSTRRHDLRSSNSEAVTS